MKKYLTGLFAVLFALSLTAFQQAPAKTVKQDGKRTNAYYYLNSSSAGDEIYDTSWELVPDQAPGEIPCTGDDEVLCTILAPEGDFGHPDFSSITDPRSSGLVTEKRFKP
jgi:hypothetical protein